MRLSAEKKMRESALKRILWVSKRVRSYDTFAPVVREDEFGAYVLSTYMVIRLKQPKHYGEFIDKWAIGCKAVADKVYDPTVRSAWDESAVKRAGDMLIKYGRSPDKTLIPVEKINEVLEGEKPNSKGIVLWDSGTGTFDLKRLHQLISVLGGMEHLIGAYEVDSGFSGLPHLIAESNYGYGLLAGCTVPPEEKTEEKRGNNND